MTDEHAHEEADTDRLVDEWHARQRGVIMREITREEIEATIKRVSKDIEALDVLAVRQDRSDAR